MLTYDNDTSVCEAVIAESTHWVTAPEQLALLGSSLITAANNEIR